MAELTGLVRRLLFWKRKSEGSSDTLLRALLESSAFTLADWRYVPAEETRSRIEWTFMYSYRGEGWPLHSNSAHNVGNDLRAAYHSAWTEAMVALGLTAEEMTPEERAILESRKDRAHQDARAFLESYFQSIWGGMRKEPPQPSMASVRARMETWINLRANAYNEALEILGKDAKLKWVLGPTEHCSTCLKMSGHVHRASTWARYARPQHPELACGGWRCQCELIPTTEPVTPGHPPGMP